MRRRAGAVGVSRPLPADPGVVKNIPDGYFNLDEKDRQVSFNEEGNEWLEKELKKAGLIAENDNLYDVKYMDIIHHANQALKAHKLFKNEVDYIVKDGQVYIVDEFTGRIMEGRRFSDGLHQALEAKEGVEVQNENQTLASITYQNYFRMYPKLAGMTGTASTEASEFEFIYGLKTVEIPTNKPVRRLDEDDCVFKNVKGKFKAIANQVEECYKKKQPVLIGTVSIEKSELLSNLLEKKHIPHQVLNAKYHERESKIIAQAGVPGAVTIATNMAGRGTDIMLGGNADFLIKDMYQQIEDPELRKIEEDKIRKKVEEDKKIATGAGGLYILGTERHESRRIDNQLRGRSGRQGDPGQSKFFLSLEDNLMRIFGGDKITTLMNALNVDENMAIESPLITRQIQSAQKKVETYHFDIRKSVLEYDDVMNIQREKFYAQRRRVLRGDDLSEDIYYMIEREIDRIIKSYIAPGQNPEEYIYDDLTTMIKELHSVVPQLSTITVADIQSLRYEAVYEKLKDFAIKAYRDHEEEVINFYNEVLTKYNDNPELQQPFTPNNIIRNMEKDILLRVVDSKWIDHLHNIDMLRDGIGLRAYGQKDPLIEYKREAYDLFNKMMFEIQGDTVKHLFRTKFGVQVIGPDVA